MKQMQDAWKNIPKTIRLAPRTKMEVDVFAHLLGESVSGIETDFRIKDSREYARLGLSQILHQARKLLRDNDPIVVKIKEDLKNSDRYVETTAKLLQTLLPQLGKWYLYLPKVSIHSALLRAITFDVFTTRGLQVMNDILLSMREGRKSPNSSVNITYRLNGKIRTQCFQRGTAFTYGIHEGTTYSAIKMPNLPPCVFTSEIPEDCVSQLKTALDMISKTCSGQKLDGYTPLPAYVARRLSALTMIVLNPDSPRYIASTSPTGETFMLIPLQFFRNKKIFAEWCQSMVGMLIHETNHLECLPLYKGGLLSLCVLEGMASAAELQYRAQNGQTDFAKQTWENLLEYVNVLFGGDAGRKVEPHVVKMLKEEISTKLHPLSERDITRFLQAYLGKRLIRA